MKNVSYTTLQTVLCDDHNLSSITLTTSMYLTMCGNLYNKTYNIMRKSKQPTGLSPDIKVNGGWEKDWEE